MGKIKKISKGYLISAIIFLLLSALLVLITSNTSVSLKTAYVFLVAILCVSAFVSSVSVGNAFGKRGLLLGILSGILYVGIFVFLVSTALNSEFISGLNNAAYIVPIVFAAVGGISGANIRK